MGRRRASADDQEWPLPELGGRGVPPSALEREDKDLPNAAPLSATAATERAKTFDNRGYGCRGRWTLFQPEGSSGADEARGEDGTPAEALSVFAEGIVDFQLPAGSGTAAFNGVGPDCWWLVWRTGELKGGISAVSSRSEMA